MIPEIKKILYTTDLSPNARFAFSYAASIANRYDAAVTIFHVIEDVSPTTDNLVINILGKDKWIELRERKENDVLDMLRSRLSRFCEEVQAELPECPFIAENIIVKIGNPVDEILQEVEENRYDLVVIGAHGHGALANALMGSTSRRVVRRCTRPVLVVRLPKNKSH
jgi:nucleotide-binding universal stress UspA family protein